MLNVLIVDDDKLLRDDLRLLLDWNKYGYQVVGEANNGINALKILESEQVDIVITDISMPKMDGIELIIKSQEMRKNVKFLVVSNYDSFKFVKEALKNGAVDYILKYEINAIKILEQLDQISSIIFKERELNIEIEGNKKFNQIGKTSAVNDFWVNVLTKKSTEVEINDLSNKLGINYLNCQYGLIAIESFEKDEVVIHNLYQKLLEFKDIYTETKHNKSDLIVVKVTEKNYVLIGAFHINSFLFVTTKMTEMAKSVHQNLIIDNKFKLNITLKEVCVNRDELYKAFQVLKQLFVSCFYELNNNVLTEKKLKNINNKLDIFVVSELEKAVILALLNKDSEALSKDIATLFNHFLVQVYQPDLVRFYILRLLDNIQMKVKAFAIDLFDIIGERKDCVEKIESCESLHQLKNWLTEDLNKFIVNTSDHLVTNMRPEIKKALEYIGEKYRKQITLDEVALYVGMSKNHFCRLFKQEVNENFTSLINRIRIDKAKYLMIKHDLKIKTVANDVGFSDYRYFCKIFKQETGVSPSDYIKQYIGNH